MTRNMQTESWLREQTPHGLLNYLINSPTIFTTVLGTRDIVVNKPKFLTLWNFCADSEHINRQEMSMTRGWGKFKTGQDNRM